MSVLKKLFNKKINQASPVQIDYQRVVNYDEEGNEYITFLPVDYKEYQKSLGTVDDWSLENLLKAGINPDFQVHTGFGTRLEGLNTLQDFERVAESILSETSDKK